MAAAATATGLRVRPARPALACARAALCPWRPAARPLATVATAVPLSGPGHDDEPVRIYRYAVDGHGQLFLHDTPVKNIATCYKDPAFLDFFFARVKPNDQPAASVAEMQRLLHLDVRVHGRDAPLPGHMPEWDRQDWPAELARLQHSTSASASLGGAGGKAATEQLAARIAQRAGYTFFSPCMGELNFIRPLEADGTPVVYRDLVPSARSPKGPSMTLSWAGRRLEPFDPAQLTLNPATGRMYHPSPRPLARAGLPVCALSDALVLRHMADALEMLADGEDGDAHDGHTVAQLHWHGRSFPIHASVPPPPALTASPVPDSADTVGRT